MVRVYPAVLFPSWRRNRPPRNTRPVPSNAIEGLWRNVCRCVVIENDYMDAEVIAEAVQRVRMRFVPIQTEEQLDLQALHRVCLTSAYPRE